MKLQAIKILHDEIMASAIEQFNSSEGLGPTMFIAEVLDNGKCKDVSMLPHEVTVGLYQGGPEEMNTFIEGLLTEGTPIRKKLQSAGLSVNLVMQIADATLTSEDNPVERRVLMCMLTQPEGSFFVTHPIEEKPVLHCIQAEFPPFESIRYKKAVAKEPGETQLRRPTMH